MGCKRTGLANAQVSRLQCAALLRQGASAFNSHEGALGSRLSYVEVA